MQQKENEMFGRESNPSIIAARAGGMVTVFIGAAIAARIFLGAF